MSTPGRSLVEAARAHLPQYGAANKTLLGVQHNRMRHAYGESTRWPKLDFGQNLNELAIDQGAKHGVHQFLYGHGQAETARKIAVVSTYPANALSPALSKLAKVELSRRDWKSTHAAEKL